MDKVKKVIFVVIADIILVGLIILSVYNLLFTDLKEVFKTIYTIVIVASIPTIFFMTYMTVAGDKYDFLDDPYADDDKDIKDDKKIDE